MGEGLSAAVGKLLSLLQRGLVTAGDADEFTSLYSRLLGTRGIWVAQTYGFDPWGTHRDMPLDWPDTHARLASEEGDPAPAILMANPLATPFVVQKHALVDPTHRRSAIYDAFTKAGFEDLMLQRFRSVTGHDIFLGAYRPRGLERFSGDDLTLVTLIYPHVAGALATRSAHATLGGAREPMSHGTAYVSFPTMKVELSGSAQRTWRRALNTTSDGVWRQVERVVAGAALEFYYGKPDSRSRMVLPTLRAELVWTPPKPGETHRVLVLFFLEEARKRQLILAAKELLSLRQRQIATLAAEGATNRRIAATLHIQVETVRTHIREILRRLDVQRRVDIAGFLSSDS